MAKYRRHSIVAILILAAVITPTPDPVTQLMVAIPLYILYEISVVISRATSKGDSKHDLPSITEADQPSGQRRP